MGLILVMAGAITIDVMKLTTLVFVRGWIIVLVGGDVAGAYIIMSWLGSTIAAPDRFGWRVLWLVGIPVSVILVVLNR